MFLDGLEDAYDKGTLMGAFAEQCAEHYQFSRTQQDDYALRSLSRALSAQQDGVFETEIARVVVKTRKGDVAVGHDEQPGNARPEKIPTLKPAFKPDGTVTPANSSSISDGASALVLAAHAKATELALPVRAVIKGHATFAHEPSWFTTAPIHAANKLLGQLNWAKDSVDLWEVNEAFAVVAMAFIRDLELSPDIVNINGGACAMGHPIGASGNRIVVTLLNALETRGLKRGIAAVCLGGGEATAIAIERP